MNIDTEYLVYTDSRGKILTYLVQLKRYNQFLWSKTLPCGTNFELQIGKPKTYLYHKSNLGEFFLSSDKITHTYSKWKRLSHITEKVPLSEIKSFSDSCCTVSSHLIFPQIEGKMNIMAQGE